jgi:glycerol kinase
VQFLADCSKLEIVVDGFVERTAFGAAALAAKALGQDLRSPSANAVGFRPRKMADDLHRRFRDGISRTIGWSVPS